MYSKNTRILIVDDADLARQLLKRHLSELGFADFVEAEGGEQALVRLEECQGRGKPVGLVFSDWHMEGMDGLELVRRMKADSRWASLPIIMITAETDASEFVKAARAGISAHVSKPIDPADLKSKLELASSGASAGGKAARGAKSSGKRSRK